MSKDQFTQNHPDFMERAPATETAGVAFYRRPMVQKIGAAVAVGTAFIAGIVVSNDREPAPEIIEAPDPDQTFDSEPEAEAEADTYNDIQETERTEPEINIDPSDLPADNTDESELDDLGTETDNESESMSDEEFAESIEQRKADQEAAVEELENAEPVYVPYNTNEEPDEDDIRALYQNIEYGILTGDISFLKASLGDHSEPDNNELMRNYLEGAEILEEGREIGGYFTPYNFEFSPRDDIEEPIRRDPQNADLFRVEVIVRNKEDITHTTHRVELMQGISQELGAQAWYIVNIYD